MRSVQEGRHPQALALGLMVLSLTAINLLWVAIDSGRVHWDFARHLGNSLFYKDTFTLSDPIQYLEGYVTYPPFMYWVTDAFYAVLGTDLWVAILSNSVFIAILVFATFGIGNTLWSPRVGFLAALFAVTSPLFVTQLRQYMLDAPLAALVALSLYLLIRSDYFSDRRYSLLLGGACGCGMLIKWTFPFFVFLPVGVAIVAALVLARREGAAGRLVNVAGAGMITVALSALWYLPHRDEFGTNVEGSGAAADILGVPEVGSLESALWYFWSLVNVQLHLVPFLFFAAGAVYLFLRDESARKNLPLLLSLVGAYIVLSAIAVKDVRYTMPMIAPIAVIAVSWLEFLKPATRRWVSRSLIAYCAVAFLVISFGSNVISKEIKIPTGTSSLTSDVSIFAPPETTRVTGIVVFDPDPLFVGAPSSEAWHQDDVFRDLVALGGTGTTFWFSDPADSIWFNTWGVRYFSDKHKAIWVGTPAEAEFLVIRGPVPEGSTAGFALVKQYPLPYDGPLQLYQRL